MDSTRQPSVESVMTCMTAVPASHTSNIDKTPTSTVRGFHGKPSWPSRHQNMQTTTTEQKDSGTAISCRTMTLFLVLHVIFLAIFSAAVIIYTTFATNNGHYKDINTMANGAAGPPLQLPKLLSSLKADMIPNLSLLTSSRVISVTVSLPDEYFTLEPEDNDIASSEKNNTISNSDSLVHRIYNVDAVEVKEGAHPTALLWLSRDNHMLIIKPDRVSLVALPKLDSLFTWIFSSASASDEERHLQTRLRGRVQVNQFTPHYPSPQNQRPLLPLPELVVEPAGPNNYESIGVSSQIRLHPSAYRWSTMNGQYVFSPGSTPVRAFQGTHVAMPLFMTPPVVPNTQASNTAAQLSNSGSYVMPQENMSAYYGNAGMPQVMAAMPQVGMPQGVGGMAFGMGPVSSGMGPLPQSTVATPVSNSGA